MSSSIPGHIYSVFLEMYALLSTHEMDRKTHKNTPDKMQDTSNEVLILLSVVNGLRSSPRG